MNLDRPLRTEADYVEAIAEVRRLWGAEPDTAEGNRLDLLLVLANAYEQEHDAIDKRIFNVDKDTFDRFMKRLDEPIAYNEKLRALLRKPAPRKKYHPSELPQHLKDALRDARMAPEHDHLNALLDD